MSQVLIECEGNIYLDAYVNLEDGISLKFIKLNKDERVDYFYRMTVESAVILVKELRKEIGRIKNQG
jgi:hypothetical protein